MFEWCDVGLWPQLAKDYLARPASLVGLGVPCISAAALQWLTAGRSPAWAQALAVALGLAAVPLAAVMQARKAIQSYINYSLNSDLANIPGTYSEPGSALWVADLAGHGVVGAACTTRHTTGCTLLHCYTATAVFLYAATLNTACWLAQELWLHWMLSCCCRCHCTQSCV